MYIYKKKREKKEVKSLIINNITKNDTKRKSDNTV